MFVCTCVLYFYVLSVLCVYSWMNKLCEISKRVTGCANVLYCKIIISHWSDFGDAYAIWRGRCVQFEMKSKRVTIGRASSSSDVDFDLLLEGASYRISRKQVLYNDKLSSLNPSLLH